MKVLHVLAQLPMKTGSGVYFSNIIEGFKNFSDIEQACLYGTNSDYDIDILGKDKQYEVYFETDNLPFSIVGMSDIMPYRNTVYSEMTEEMIFHWKKSFTEKLIKIKEEFNPDIIITHHLWMLTSIVCEVFNDKKIVAICHNTDIRQAEKHNNMKDKYVTNLDKLDKVLSLSNNQIDDIVKVYNYDRLKIQNIGAGYNDKVFYPPKEQFEKNNVELIYAGKFDESKGFYELIKAFKQLQDIHNDVTLDLIGNVKDEDKEKIENSIKNIKNISIYNVSNQKELADVMRTKDIFVLPSYFEGLGLIAVEALGSGLRAVTTDIAGLIEFLGEKINNSEVIEYVKMPTIYDTDKAVEEEKPYFINRLVEAINTQIIRTRKERSLPENIVIEIEKHSWNEKIKELYNIINSL
ncbi:glycosyltransferase [Gemella sp. GH3]|uniref:glycosyltransferase family 4 protein n=1 Tax=unclassified Gemella TaxID=2624949 RepID=UPI0015CFE1A8|nr:MULTISPECIES: glycosyltransferase family 4 protein [unclassified Gemella]MBF0714232.1 glycosyltransferase [Gemella sp. GH3.1]NYS51184.1 glycosyltransferase [Gemella sp. GH3]